jgi:hypothetical protein
MTSEAAPQTRKHVKLLASLVNYYFCPASGRAVVLTDRKT